MEIYNKLFGLLLISLLIEAVPEETGHVEVRAVLISCATDDRQSVPFDNEELRFVREELYKHTVLRDCRKKLALTVKIASDPNNSGDEYIPIEHVFQGPKKRVRLLNPYVLRLRRDRPLQAYKLHKVHTVHGTLTKNMKSHLKHNLVAPDALNVEDQMQNLQPGSTSRELPEGTETCEMTPQRSNNLYSIRNKWDKNSVQRSSESINNGDITHKTAKDSFASDVNDLVRAYDETASMRALSNSLPERSDNYNYNIKDQSGEVVLLADEKSNFNEEERKSDPKLQHEVEIVLPDVDETNESPNLDSIKRKAIVPDDNMVEYDMYEISNADLWNTIQVQLFEKLSTPDGKTVWNDLCKGEPARVSSLAPEWSGPDVSIQYRSSQWVPREDFTLPVTSMCLLTPVKKESTRGKTDKTLDEYIVLPREDVVVMRIDGSDRNTRDHDLPEVSTEPHERPRRVVISTARAIMGFGDKASIVAKAGDKFLTLLHRQPHHAQIDLEARADENQLVHVGSYGRIMTVVADSSRRTRTVLTVQATNTGLTASRFRVVARDCNPELPELLDEKLNESADKFVVLPPKHTQNIRLDLPTEIPVDTAHCSVVLMNGDDHSVAVRDVTIRKGDRCFCVWHCECVCLGEDPKLLCREMPEVRQVAAGLTLHERTRHIRSVCYHDVVPVNMCVTAVGVLATLLLFGMLKACLGLCSRNVGIWGLDRIVQMPRKLDHYYEASLRDRKVVYDDEGWPVHPDTKKRTVRMIASSMELMLNTIFFVTAPCVIVYEALYQVYCRFKKQDGNASTWSKNTNNCYSSHDMQTTNGRRRRWRYLKLQRWMTPEAETLTSNVLQKGLPIHDSMIRNFMRPLLREECRERGDAGAPAAAARRDCDDSDVGDTEVDDTEYVLTQMQKSRESLAQKSQRRLNGSVSATTQKQ